MRVQPFFQVWQRQDAFGPDGLGRTKVGGVGKRRFVLRPRNRDGAIRPNVVADAIQQNHFAIEMIEGAQSEVALRVQMRDG